MIDPILRETITRQVMNPTSTPEDDALIAQIVAVATRDGPIDDEKLTTLLKITMNSGLSTGLSIMKATCLGFCDETLDALKPVAEQDKTLAVSMITNIRGIISEVPIERAIDAA